MTTAESVSLAPIDERRGWADAGHRVEPGTRHDDEYVDRDVYAVLSGEWSERRGYGTQSLPGLTRRDRLPF